MKSIIIRVFITIICISCTQKSAQDIVINQTKNHITVEGTSLKMVPPKNFRKGENFYGYQQLKTHATIIAFQVKTGFTMQTKGFTQDHLANSGFEVNEILRFKINNDSAVYVSAKQPWEGELFFKEIIAIGNEDRTVVINAACPIQYEEMVSHLKKSLFSSYIDDGNITSAKDLVDFTLNPKDTGLKFYEPPTKGLNALVYQNRSLPEKPMLIATKSLIAINDDHETFAKESIKTLGLLTPEETIMFDKISIDGLHGYESISKGKDDHGNVVFLYRVIVYTIDNYYYTFAGRLTGKLDDKNIQNFKKLITTFQRKE